jgi:hypothetical protein
MNRVLEQLQAGVQELFLWNQDIGDDEVVAIAAVLAANRTLITSLDLSYNRIGPVGARALAATLNTTLITSLDLSNNNIGAEGARWLARNATRITRLNLDRNNIGPVGARYLAAALNTTRITSLYLTDNNIGAEGARSLAAALDNNRTLQRLGFLWNNIGADIMNLLEDRLRVNQIVPKIASWVATTAARVKPLDNTHNNLPPDFAARAAVLAFGEELLLGAPWLSPGGRKFAADNLMPLAETALILKLRRG